MASNPIRPVRTTNESQPLVHRYPEAATQTYIMGTPVENITNDAGYISAWDANVAHLILGISAEDAANLTTHGTAKQLTFGTVLNQSSASNISRPYFNDGKTGTFVGALGTVFEGQCASTSTFAQTDIGKQYGLTKDTDNHWYIDKTKTGANAVLTIVGIDANDTRGAYFTFNSSSVSQQS